MDPEVAARHIRLYVNDYTRALDERAVMKMLEWGERDGIFPPADPDLPVFFTEEGRRGDPREPNN
jgi:predicted solute-binding protein